MNRKLHPRNTMAKALSCKIFAKKVIPVKKGKGSIYSRKGRVRHED